jgi:hypothetical protein
MYKWRICKFWNVLLTSIKYVCSTSFRTILITSRRTSKIQACFTTTWCSTATFVLEMHTMNSPLCHPSVRWGKVGRGAGTIRHAKAHLKTSALHELASARHELASALHELASASWAGQRASWASRHASWACQRASWASLQLRLWLRYRSACGLSTLSLWLCLRRDGPLIPAINGAYQRFSSSLFLNLFRQSGTGRPYSTIGNWPPNIEEFYGITNAVLLAACQRI